jgi:hypothetical protein
MSTNKTIDQDFIFTPLETATATIEHIKNMQNGKDKSIPFPIDGIDEYFAPLRPGQMAAIIGQTSHYKSGLLHSIERINAEGLSKGQHQGEVIFHISTEEDIEEQGMIELAHYSPERMEDLVQGHVLDWDSVIKAAFQIGEVPIYRIGMSLHRKGRFSDLYLSNIAREIERAMEEFNITPASIYIDYLQALPLDPDIQKNAPRDQQRRLQVRSDVYRLKEMAVYFECPIWVAIQAKQNLDMPLSPTFLMPGQYDGEETAAIAQRFDRLVTIWMPKQSWPVGKEVSLGKGSTIRVEEDMLFVRVAKQRPNLPSGRMWLCRVDFKRNEIRVDATMKTYVKGDIDDSYGD